MFDITPTTGMFSKRNMDPSTMLRELCAVNEVKLSVVRGRSRDKWLVDFRRRAAEMLFTAGLSYSEIGRMLGGRHHTTIMSLLNPEMSARKYEARKQHQSEEEREAA